LEAEILKVGNRIRRHRQVQLDSHHQSVLPPGWYLAQRLLIVYGEIVLSSIA
jgi:hypothetical protein